MNKDKPIYQVREYETEGALARNNIGPELKIHSDVFAEFDDDGVRETVQKAMKHFLDFGITRDEVQDKMGIHWRTWLEIRKGESKRLMQKTVRALEEFNARCERAALRKEERGLITKFIETENVAKIRLTLKDCLRNYQEGLYVVLGPSGCGKTSALTYIMAEMARSGEFEDWRIVKVHVHEHHSCKTLLMEICEEIGLDTSRNCTTPKMIQRLAREFKARRTAVIFDEADWLMNRKKLNLLRILWDKAPFACYLLGVADIFENFYRNHAGNTQLMGRIYGFVQIHNLKMKDIFKFFEESNLKPEVMERIYTLTGGNAHVIRKMVRKIDVFTKGGRNVTKAAAEEILNTLMFVGQF